MSNVLYVYANPKPLEQSYTLRLAKSFIDDYQKIHPQDVVTGLDLYKADIPFINEDVLGAWGKLGQGITLTEAEGAAVGRMSVILQQFTDADKVIFGVPMWNFSFPPIVKAYIDNLVIAGKSFKYTAQGPIGLLNDKPVLFIQSRGGFYGQEPMKSFEMAESYFKNVLGFLGIHNFKALLCEGVNFTPDKAEDLLKSACDTGALLAKSF